MTNLRTALRALAGVVVAGGLLMAAPLAASATTSNLPPCHACTTVVKTDASGLLLTSNGEAKTETNPDSAAVVHVGNGVDAELPDALAKVGYTVVLDQPVLLSAIAKIEYATWQLTPGSVALPSVNLTLDYDSTVPGVQFTTLVYEPYQDGRDIHLNQWQNWDALRNGNGKWWSTRALALLPGNGQQASPQPWTDILTKYPHAQVLAYGLNFGKGSAGAHARWKSITFGTIDWCTTTTWPTPGASPSASASASASATPTGTPTAAPTTPVATLTPDQPPADPTTPGPVATASPGGQGGVTTALPTTPGGQLVLTGQNVNPLLYVGGGAVLLGASVLLGLWVTGRRRRRVAG